MCRGILKVSKDLVLTYDEMVGNVVMFIVEATLDNK
jgi:hypothetical protein